MRTLNENIKGFKMLIVIAIIIALTCIFMLHRRINMVSNTQHSVAEAEIILAMKLSTVNNEKQKIRFVDMKIAELGYHSDTINEDAIGSMLPSYLILATFTTGGQEMRVTKVVDGLR